MIIGIYYNSAGIPLSGLVNEPLLFVGLYKIIQRAKGTITITTQFGIGMQGIVKHLVLQPNG